MHQHMNLPPLPVDIVDLERLNKDIFSRQESRRLAKQCIEQSTFIVKDGNQRLSELTNKFLQLFSKAAQRQ